MSLKAAKDAAEHAVKKKIKIILKLKINLL